MADSVIEEIKSLQEKQEKAQTLLTRYTVTLESLVAKKEKLEEQLLTEHGTTASGATEKLESLKTELNSLLFEAKQSLDKINL